MQEQEEKAPKDVKLRSWARLRYLYIITIGRRRQNREKFGEENRCPTFRCWLNKLLQRRQYHYALHSTRRYRSIKFQPTLLFSQTLSSYLESLKPKASKISFPILFSNSDLNNIPSWKILFPALNKDKVDKVKKYLIWLRATKTTSIKWNDRYPIWLILKKMLLLNHKY